MYTPILPLLLGFVIDLFFGDPHEIPHPVVWIGKLISFLENNLREVFPKTAKGERIAGFILWVVTVTISTGSPWLILYFFGKVSVYLRVITESIMCWQIIAVRDLKLESMKVYNELAKDSLPEAIKAVSMIVGRDTENLDETGVIKAAVETIAENTSDGIAAPLFYIALFGTSAGFFYKAVNTMDSMIGYVDPPYTNFGWFPAKADDVFNFIPSRIAAMLMLIAGGLQKLDLRNGWKIFVRDRYNHASPNSAQTESVCAGLLRVQLAGDAYYHGVLHKKQFIGDPLRNVEQNDIPRTCRLMYLTSVLLLILSCFIRMVVI